MDSKTFYAKNVEDLSQIAPEILEFTKHSNVFLFFGEMGAGKTTLIKALCNHLGVEDNTSSPTFSIVNEYQGYNLNIYHFDFYRIKNEQEAYDMGYEEYLYSNNICFIEWPEKIENLWPEGAINITINLLDNLTREIKVSI